MAPVSETELSQNCLLHNKLRQLAYTSGHYLYCNWNQFFLRVHVEQAQTSSHIHRLSILHSGWDSIHYFLITQEYIAFLYRAKNNDGIRQKFGNIV